MTSSIAVLAHQFAVIRDLATEARTDFEGRWNRLDLSRTAAGVGSLVALAVAGTSETRRNTDRGAGRSGTVGRHVPLPVGRVDGSSPCTAP